MDFDPAIVPAGGDSVGRCGRSPEPSKQGASCRQLRSHCCSTRRNAAASEGSSRRSLRQMNLNAAGTVIPSTIVSPCAWASAMAMKLRARLKPTPDFTRSSIEGSGSTSATFNGVTPSLPKIRDNRRLCAECGGVQIQGNVANSHQSRLVSLCWMRSLHPAGASNRY